MVTFLDQWNTPEVGDDLGGLTTEMYTQFWDEVRMAGPRLTQLARPAHWLRGIQKRLRQYIAGAPWVSGEASRIIPLTLTTTTNH